MRRSSPLAAARPIFDSSRPDPRFRASLGGVQNGGKHAGSHAMAATLFNPGSEAVEWERRRAAQLGQRTRFGPMRLRGKSRFPFSSGRRFSEIPTSLSELYYR